MKAAPTYYLNIGEIIVCAESSIISTVLGSCVSVCLYSKNSRMGGMIHFAHPRMASHYGQNNDFRYGETAIPVLIRELQKTSGEPANHFVAKIVGGASETGGVRISYDIGAENVKIARKILAEYGIKIIGEDIGGFSGRKVLYHTATNRLLVAKLTKQTPFDRSNAVKPTAEKHELKSEAISLSPRKRKVLIVDDSKTIRTLLHKILSEDSCFEIVGMAGDVFEAEKLIAKERPDVITLDIHMPGMTGVEWLAKLLPANPIPVVMISSLQFQEGNEVFRALELGAVDYIQKPSLADLPIVGPIIREKVKEASFARVQTQISRIEVAVQGEIDFRKVLAIGASTGGTEALKAVLVSLPAQIPPTVIVQHIPPVFSKAFADRLNSLCSFEVKEAEDGDELRPSRVLIAPGGKQMKADRTARGLCVRVTDDPPVNRHKPSVDYLFESVASVIGKNSVGVILTGMGADGARGLLEMKRRGAQTIGQDEKTSVVYGMPKVAFELGAVETVAPLNEIPRVILNKLARQKSA